MIVFCSYARDDEDSRGFIREFFEALCLKVRAKTGLRMPEPGRPCLEQPDPIAFFDQKAVALGEQWSPKIAQALNSCKVMICLYSPTYFQSSYCGKEFGYFQKRQAYHAEKHPDQKVPDVILPVIWEPCDEHIPAQIKGVNHFDGVSSPIYKNHGLTRLASLKEHKDLYTVFVDNLAERIKKIVKEEGLESFPEPLAIDQVANAFEKTQLYRKKEEEELSTSPQGPNTVKFVYVVATQQELRGVRSTVNHYGDKAAPLWSPYPPPENAIGVIASSLAAGRKKLYPDRIDADSRLLDKLAEAKEANSLVLLLVDTWSLKIEPYQQLMKSYDDTNHANCAAMVIWDDTKETEQNAGQLEALTRKVFNDNYKTRLPRFFLPKVGSLGELQKELEVVLDTLQVTVLSTGEPMRTLPPGRRDLPRIQNNG